MGRLVGGRAKELHEEVKKMWRQIQIALSNQKEAFLKKKFERLKKSILTSFTDGKWTDWSSWSACSSACGSGTQSRSRNCTNPPPAYGGAPCSLPSTEMQSCNTQPCPIGNFIIHTISMKALIGEKNRQLFNQKLSIMVHSWLPRFR